MWRPDQVLGVVFWVSAACLSMISVFVLLTVMGVSAIRKRSSPRDYEFLRTHAATYFACQLVCDLLQAVGSSLSIQWLRNKGITNNGLCVAQGALKHTGNVGTALWTIVIATDTFLLLFCRKQVTDRGFYIILVSVWLFLGLVISIGPAKATTEKGPFYGPTGFWCQVATKYATERYTLEYLFMFAGAGISCVLYPLIFLRLRGNIVIHGWKISFKRRLVVKGYNNPKFNAFTDPSQNTIVMKVARHMIFYPIAYTTLITPILVIRILSLVGTESPYQATLTAGTIYMLCGFVNAVLFITTRRILPAKYIFPKFIRERFGISSGVGSNTQQRSFINTTMETHRSEVGRPDIIDIGVSIEVGMVVDYDSDFPASKSVSQTEPHFRPFDGVTPFNQQSSPVHGTKGIRDDWDESLSDRGRGSNVGSSSDRAHGSDAGPTVPAVVDEGETNLPSTIQYPSQIHPLSPIISPDIYECLNPRNRGDRGRSGVYTYGPTYGS